MKRIIIYGIFGTMGQLVLEYLQNVEDVEIFGVDKATKCNSEIISNDINDFKADVVIDFSSREAIYDLIAYSKNTKTPLVLCSTGYTGEEINMIHKACEQVPIFFSSSMSYGVNVLLYLTQQATKLLDTFDVEIVEKHYNTKKETPSRTSLLFATSVKAIRPLSRRYGRPRSEDSPREEIEIGMHSVRGGTVAGEHEIGFYGDSERISLTHSTENVHAFAKGAATAGLYMIGKTQPKCYDMQDIVEENLANADADLSHYQ